VEPSNEVGTDSVTVTVDSDFIPYGDLSPDNDGITNPSLFIAPETVSSPEFGPFSSEPDAGTSKADVGDTVDAAIADDSTKDRPLIDPERAERATKGKADVPKSGPPNLDEWQDFFSRIILRFGMEWYTDYVFRGVDEDLVSDRDIQRLRVTREERDTIAKPFAEYANKNPFVRKHGRQVVALTGSIESVVALGVWISRVNRIAGKYKPKKVKKATHGRTTIHPNGGNHNGHNGQSQRQEFIGGSTGGRLPDGFYVDNPGSS
jgi:hypothetical protein